ncbi:MAG: DUF58 domain-containing protein [Candidatus Brocadiia bacterium]|nr:DUF58 domain-containing protein [Planctomycetota bacterium]
MPSAEEYLRPDVIQQVSRLDLQAKFIVEGFISGLHDSPYQGFSTEFSEHRKYSPGDDLKNIDWNVYGRTDRYYIKKFEAETNLSCYLLVDVSSSMQYSYGGITKLKYSCCMAAALGYLMINQQDAVGLATFDEDLVHYVPPKSKRSHLTGILSGLDAEPRDRPSRIGPSLHKAAELFPRRGLAVLFSDLIPTPDENEKEIIEALDHLIYRGHDVICFQVLDHAELTMPYEGRTRFRDMETQEEVVVQPEALQEDYQREIRQFADYYKEKCGETDIDYVLVDTSVSFDRVLVTYLTNRREHF